MSIFQCHIIIKFRYLDTRSLTQDEANTLKQWMLKEFGGKIKNVKVKILIFHLKFHFIYILFRLIQNLINIHV